MQERENTRYFDNTTSSCAGNTWQISGVTGESTVNHSGQVFSFFTANEKTTKNIRFKMTDRHSTGPSGLWTASTLFPFSFFAFENIIKANQLCCTVANTRRRELGRAITCSSTHAVRLIASCGARRYKRKTEWHFRTQINEHGSVERSEDTRQRSSM